MMSKQRRKPEREPTRQPEASGRDQGRTEALSNGILEAGWLIALALVPLFFNIYSARTYEPDKIVVLRSLVIVMVAAWLWKILAGGRAWRPIDEGREGGGLTSSQHPPSSLRRLAGQPLLVLTGLLAISLLVGSALSIDPRLSWWGSYARFQGTGTSLSYIAFFALVAAHLRTPHQWQRIVFTILTTSVPISLYALLQAAGLDPVPHEAAVERSFSTLGNPIFLGAYLLMVLFVTLLELGRAAIRFQEQRSLSTSLCLLIISGITALQMAALVLTQSRGPFLGALAGAYVFCLVLSLEARARALASARSSSFFHQSRRWLWAAVIGIGLIGAGFLVTLNLPHSPLAPLKRVPHIGRLGSILDFESNTVQVRLLIWDGVIELLGSDRPLIPPGGTPEPLAAIRPYLGHGPETLPLAINRHIPSELGQLQGRNDIPDRSHNETFDVLVMNGTLGYAIWLGVYCSAFFLALTRLGLMRSGPQRLSFWVNLSLGAALGAVGPFLLQGRWTLSGVGLPAGIISGLMVFITLEALIGELPPTAKSRRSETGLVIALLATLIAHVIEIHFGIAIVATRLYFWFFVAVLLATAQGWLTVSEKPVFASAGGVEDPRASVWPGLVTGVIGAALVFGLLLNPHRLTQPIPLLAVNLWPASGGTAEQPATLISLLLATLATGAILAAGSAPRGDRRTIRRLMTRALLLAASLCMLFGIAHSRLVAQAASFRQSYRDPLEVALAGTRMFDLFVWLMLLLVVTLGVAIGRPRPALRIRRPRESARSSVSGLALALGVVWLVHSTSLEPIRSDTLLKEARALLAAGGPAVGLRLLDHACDLDPREPMLFLHRGRAAMQAARAAANPAARAGFFESAQTALTRARELAPLDPDHSANLARFFVQRAVAVDDPDRRSQFHQRAEAEYREALDLRPSSVIIVNELALLLVHSNRLDEAEDLLAQARTLDDRYAPTFFNLGNVHQARAAATSRSEELGTLIDSLERAVAAYERALLIEPAVGDASRALERLRRALGRFPARPMTPERLQELYGLDAATHTDLALFHFKQGRSALARAHARLAIELAKPEQIAAARSVLAEIEAKSFDLAR